MLYEKKKVERYIQRASSTRFPKRCSPQLSALAISTLGAASTEVNKLLSWCDLSNNLQHASAGPFKSWQEANNHFGPLIRIQPPSLLLCYFLSSSVASQPSLLNVLTGSNFTHFSALCRAMPSVYSMLLCSSFETVPALDNKRLNECLILFWNWCSIVSLNRNAIYKFSYSLANKKFTFSV